MQEGIPYLRTPALSPDGRSLAFVYANDIWLVNSSGGSAERLTVHPTTNLHPRFSPDGAYLACTSTRTGGGDIYVLPLKENGDIRRLTYNGRYCSVQDWAADGQHLYFTCDREHQGQSIYRVSLTGETPTQLYAEPYETLAHATTSPDGSLLAFNVVRRRWWRSGPDPFSPCDIWLGNTRPAAPQDEA
jgi:Tol biopolymer transport system component